MFYNHLNHSRDLPPTLLMKMYSCTDPIPYRSIAHFVIKTYAYTPERSSLIVNLVI